MSTVTRTTNDPQPARRPVTATTTRRTTVTKSNAPLGNQVFLFDQSNYTWMIGGVVLILLGFFLMTGGKSPDPHQFNYAEIYSVRRITIAPIVLLLGFAVEVYAIMKKPTVAVVEKDMLVTTQTTTTTTVG